MKIPLKWLENYISLEHTPKEFADIMTKLEFMQDGPIIEVNGQPVVDLEVRQNRPDSFSIIGLAREYAAYVNKKITLPEMLTEIPVGWGSPKNLISVKAKDLTKRFCAIHIKNIKVQNSPDWLIQNLEAYGIPAINNVVDITNYVMLEYGMPLHAFDVKKLGSSKNKPSLLTIRKASATETLTTWQKSDLKLNSKDLVISSTDQPVALAGIIGAANSGIDEKTTEIILESACYDQASVRKTSIRHNIRTEASTRHEKFLNPEMVEMTIRRALFLLTEMTGSEIVAIEDYYENREDPLGIELNLFEIARIGGIQLDPEEAANLLVRLGFEIIEQKEAIGLNQNIIVVKVPIWRTDVNIDADLIEEILRLWGYENLPLQPLREATEDYSTYDSIQLEEKIRDILVNLGLDEHITNPLVKYSDDDKTQIKLENPLNSDKNALRTTIIETLSSAIITNQKAGKENIALFEIGKIYKKAKEADFKEQKLISAIYEGYDFGLKIKPDFIAILTTLGLDTKLLRWEKDNSTLVYKYANSTIGVLRHDGYDLMTENLTQIIDLKLVPTIKIKTDISQVIIEEIAFVYKKGLDLGILEPLIYKSHDKITKVNVNDIYDDESILGQGMISANISIIFEDSDNKLSREEIIKTRELILEDAKKAGFDLRS